jgi:hypothetical protein
LFPAPDRFDRAQKTAFADTGSATTSEPADKVEKAS